MRYAEWLARKGERLFSLGEAVAEEIYCLLLQYGMEQKVFGCLADTTASNFGRWSGAITVLQVGL